MEDYHFDIQWLEGKENVVADFLSRNASGTINAMDTSPTALATEQARDPMLQEVRRAVMSGDNRGLPPHWKIFFPQLQIKQDILVIKLQPRKGFMDKDTFKAVLPGSLHKEVMDMAHASIYGGHTGLLKTRERIREEFWWPAMEGTIETYLKTCKTCQEFSKKWKAPVRPEQIFQLPTAPNQRIHVDLFGPLKDNKGKKGYVLVITDSFTKFVQLKQLPDKTATTVAEAILHGWIYTFGVMKILVSDGGLEFCNSLQEELWKILKIDHKKTSPYWPRTNGQAEVFNKTIIHYLSTILGQGQQTSVDWNLYLAPLAFSYNTAVSRALKMSPFRALFSYEPRAPLWQDLDELLEKDSVILKSGRDQDYLHDWSKIQERTRKVAHANNQQDQEMRRASKEKAQPRNTATAEFKTGDKVWIVLHEAGYTNRKFAPKWEPAVITRRASETTFIVNRTSRARKKTATINANYIKHRSTEQEEPPEPRKNTIGEEEHLDQLASIMAIEIMEMSATDEIEFEIRAEKSDLIQHFIKMRKKLANMKNPPFSLSLGNYGTPTPVEQPQGEGPPGQGGEPEEEEATEEETGSEEEDDTNEEMSPERLETPGSSDSSCYSTPNLSTPSPPPTEPIRSTSAQGKETPKTGPKSEQVNRKNNSKNNNNKQ
jgi:hypothetical protein